MVLGHVLCKCCKSSFAKISLVTCRPFILKQYLHCAGGKTDLNLLPCKLIGYAVVVAIDLDMVVIDLGLFPLSILIWA